MAFNYNNIKANINMIRRLQTNQTLLQDDSWLDMLRLEVISLVNNCVPYAYDAVSHQLFDELTSINGQNVVLIQIRIQRYGNNMPLCRVIIRVDGEYHSFTLTLAGGVYNVAFHNSVMMISNNFNRVMNRRARRMIIFG